MWLRLAGLLGVAVVVGMVLLLRQPTPDSPAAANNTASASTSPTPPEREPATESDNLAAGDPGQARVITDRQKGAILGLVRWHTTTITVTAGGSTANAHGLGLSVLDGHCTSTITSDVHNGPVDTDPQVTINVAGTSSATVQIHGPADAPSQITTVELALCAPTAPGAPTAPVSPAVPRPPRPISG
jgi:hypothetical protein